MRVSLLIILLLSATAIYAGKSIIRVQNGIGFSFKIYDKKLLDEKPADDRLLVPEVFDGKLSFEALLIFKTGWRYGVTQPEGVCNCKGRQISLFQTRLIWRPFLFPGIQDAVERGVL